jgi:hypothetical protein
MPFNLQGIELIDARPLPQPPNDALRQRELPVPIRPKPFDLLPDPLSPPFPAFTSPDSSAPMYGNNRRWSGSLGSFSSSSSFSEERLSEAKDRCDDKKISVMRLDHVLLHG